MKTLKILFTALTLFISISSFVNTSFAKETDKSFLLSTVSDHVEYIYIEGILWKITYDDNYNIISREPIFD